MSASILRGHAGSTYPNLAEYGTIKQVQLPKTAKQVVWGFAFVEMGTEAEEAALKP